MNKAKVRRTKAVNATSFISEYMVEVLRCLIALDTNRVARAVEMLMDAYRNKQKVFIMGNGGSAANASHMALDLGKGTLARVYDPKETRFRVISLTDNVATITAYGNDLSFDDIFVQQLRNLVEPNDLVIVLSGSGNSPNVVKAVAYAKGQRAKTIGILGFKTGGKLARMVDCAIIVDSLHYGPCEDIQLILDHIFTSCIAIMKGEVDGISARGVTNQSVPFRASHTVRSAR